MLVPSMECMECALALAKLALGFASPNPAVGAVIVQDGLIVGQGYTQPPGSDHAEIVALRQAGDKAKGATMYVTLEPCCHYGRTPPCTRAIIDAGISEIHLAMIDPNPMISGRGVSELEEVGIRTYIGELEDQAREVNEAYIKFITTGLPFVIAKFAMSLDGKIATRTGESEWISNEQARRYVHSLRHGVDAIMVGVNTAIIDNPRLVATGCCGKGGRAKKQPLRLVVDSKGRIPLEAQLFKQPGKTLLVTVKPLDPGRCRELAEIGAEVLELPQEAGLVDLRVLLRALGKRQVLSVLVEGGSKVFGSLFDGHSVDKVLAFISPIIIGGDKARTAVGGNGVGNLVEALRLSRVNVECFGDNILVSGYVSK